MEGDEGIIRKGMCQAFNTSETFNHSNLNTTPLYTAGDLTEGCEKA